MADFTDPARRYPPAFRADEQLRAYAERVGGLTLEYWQLVLGRVWGRPYMMTMDVAAKRLNRRVHELERIELETHHALGWVTDDQPSRLDLRVPTPEKFEDELLRVERGLGVRLERESLLRKRRTSAGPATGERGYVSRSNRAGE